ncbi:MAG: hypothetical protein ACREQF_12235 [Candidatus Binataceae bacterium]
MADLGNRANVMGPQPIIAPKPRPPEMLATAERVLRLLADGKKSELQALASERVRAEIGSIADSIRGRGYDGGDIIGIARTSDHYWIKARLIGRKAEPFVVQFRLGAKNGSWTIRYAANLTGKRSGWTK